jgi:hypothetical protein
VRRPLLDEGHVETGAHEVGADRGAVGAGSDHGDALV